MEIKVIQFAPDATIRDYPEIDFGYMKTKKKEDSITRSAKGKTFKCSITRDI